MSVESQSEDGLRLAVNYGNDTWGEMKTAWRFFVDDGRIGRFATGQA